MRRLVDYFSGALSGMLVALLICAAVAPDAWTVAPTPRPSPQSADPSLRREDDGRIVSPVPSPDSGARTWAADQRPAPLVVSPTPAGTRPAASARPRTASPPRHKISGTATWFRSPAGVSAAGPALRAAVGPGWRGQRVTVCAWSRCARTVLGDWMRADKLIDLDDNVFRAVCGALPKGVCTVEVRW